MKHAQFIFHAQLQDFLPSSDHGSKLLYSFKNKPSVKHMIEAAGIPHTEIERITVNGMDVDFKYLMTDGDRVEVYPFHAEFEDQETARLPAVMDGEPRFVLDNHLGKLATYLRILGFDSLYQSDYQDDALARIASCEDRILLTRDCQLLMRRTVQFGYWVRKKNPPDQVLEVMLRYNLFRSIRPFHRCLRCNAVLRQVKKEDVLDRLEPLTKKYYFDFHWCAVCDQVYWKGSHYERMENFIRKVIEQGTCEK